MKNLHCIHSLLKVTFYKFFTINKNNDCRKHVWIETYVQLIKCIGRRMNVKRKFIVLLYIWPKCFVQLYAIFPSRSNSSEQFNSSVSSFSWGASRFFFNGNWGRKSKNFVLVVRSKMENRITKNFQNH